MIVNFNEIEETILKNFCGGEKEVKAHMLVDENGKIMHGELAKGASIGYHKHEESSEILLILEGDAKVLYDDTVEYLKAGDCHYCPKGHSHSLINNGEKPLVFFAVVSRQ